MTISQAYSYLKEQLNTLYDPRECINISDWIMEHLTGYKKSERLIHKDDLLTTEQENTFLQYCDELIQHKPVQYVLHEAWFAGMSFYVDENVLIPRPETEELVEWIIESISSSASVLDIGTGSGCIPITIKKQLPQTNTAALDISIKALDVCTCNAKKLEAAITCTHLDILDETKWSSMPQYDCIVSNPPYIRESEQNEMHHNVLQHEPHLALFVPDNDALLFYRKIASFAQSHLNKGGYLFFEINEALGNEMITLLTLSGFSSIELKKDLQGKDRMIKAVKSQ